MKGVGVSELPSGTVTFLFTDLEGVWLCESGPVADRSLIPEVVAAALGVQQRPWLSLAEALMVVQDEAESHLTAPEWCAVYDEPASAGSTLTGTAE